VPAGVYVGAGATALLVAASAVTGIVYLGRTEPDDAGNESSARRLGWVNAGLWAASALGAGVTIYLYATRPEQSEMGSPRLTTRLSARGGALSLETRF